MLPVAAVLTLALAAGCERRSTTDDTSGTTRTTGATPGTDMTRDAAYQGTTGATDTSGAQGTPGTTGTMGTTGTTGTTGTMGTSDTSGATGTTATGGKAEQHQQPLESHDKEFMTKAAEGSMAEVALGTEVSQKATTPEVKSLADRMVTDHTKANDELKSLAAKKGVMLPSDIDKSDKNEQAKLAKLSGKQLDKEYADHMVKDHEKDLKEFQKAAKDAKDPELKSWAAKMVPILQEHLNEAKQVDAKVKR
jgi:putative membrane protein